MDTFATNKEWKTLSQREKDAAFALSLLLSGPSRLQPKLYAKIGHGDPHSQGLFLKVPSQNAGLRRYNTHAWRHSFAKKTMGAATGPRTSNSGPKKLRPSPLRHCTFPDVQVSEALPVQGRCDPLVASSKSRRVVAHISGGACETAGAVAIRYCPADHAREVAGADCQEVQCHPRRDRRRYSARATRLMEQISQLDAIYYFKCSSFKFTPNNTVMVLDVCLNLLEDTKLDNDVYFVPAFLVVLKYFLR